MGDRKLGLAIIGLGGAVGTTIIAGIELITNGLVGTEGLPLSDLNESVSDDLIGYQRLGVLYV